MARRWIAKHEPSYDAGGALNFAVEERASQVLVGFIGIGGDDRRAGMGYWYGRPFWGQGLRHRGWPHHRGFSALRNSASNGWKRRT